MREVEEEAGEEELGEPCVGSTARVEAEAAAAALAVVDSPVAVAVAVGMTWAVAAAAVAGGRRCPNVAPASWPAWVWAVEAGDKAGADTRPLLSST
jgi:xanthine dehydrogenase molybdopterin-binding subunit B